jgi:hypothetical protein
MGLLMYDKLGGLGRKHFGLTGVLLKDFPERIEKTT